MFIAWFKQEQDHPLAEIAVVAELIDKGSLRLVVSVVSFTEVLCGKVSSSQADQFKLFLKRPNIQVVDANPIVAMKAAEIIKAGLQESPQRKLRLPDAYILATAIGTGVAVLHTVDDQLLALDQLPIVDGLRIETPSDPSGQQALGLQP